MHTNILNYNIQKHPLKNCIILLRNYLNNLLSHDMNYEIINFLDLKNSLINNLKNISKELFTVNFELQNLLPNINDNSKNHLYMEILPNDKDDIARLPFSKAFEDIHDLIEDQFIKFKCIIFEDIDEDINKIYNTNKDHNEIEKIKFKIYISKLIKTRVNNFLGFDSKNLNFNEESLSKFSEIDNIIKEYCLELIHYHNFNKSVFIKKYLKDMNELVIYRINYLIKFLEVNQKNFNEILLTWKKYENKDLYEE